MSNTVMRAGKMTVRGRPETGVPAFGLFFAPANEGPLDGWEGTGGDATMTRTTRPNQVGAYDVPAYASSRVVTFRGVAFARSEQELARYGRQVRGVGADGGKVLVSVDHLGEEWRARGRRIFVDFPDQGLRDEHGFLYAKFEIQFEFADPRKYGAMNTFPASGAAKTVVASHRGNMPAHPEIEVPAAAASYTITSPGGTYTVSGAPAGKTHVIRMRNGRLYVDGVWQTGVSSGDKWAIPADEDWSHTISVGSMILRVEDTDI